MPNKTVGNNPLYSSRGASKLTPAKATSQNSKKVKPVSSDSAKITAGKSGPGKNKIKN